MEMLLSCFVLLCSISISLAAGGSFGTACNSNSDCDSTKRLTCLMLYGPSCASIGRCDCPSNNVWDVGSSTCVTGKGVQDACSSSAYCSKITTLDGSGKAATCSNSKCACPTNYYPISSSKFQCANNPGSTIQGGICTAQSNCARNLLCGLCPGSTTGTKYCFGFTKQLGLQGVGCNSYADCDATKGLTCLLMYGPTCSNQGRCECINHKLWNSATNTCGVAKGVQDTCSSNADCNKIVTLDGSGKPATCSNGKCACPPNYFQLSVNKFQCVNSHGATTQGGICNSQSDCAQNLLCSYCPGGTTGTKYCLGFTKSLGKFGDGCNTNPDCDTNKGLTCNLMYGPTCSKQGRCECGNINTWEPNTHTCTTAKGPLDTCTTNNDCNNIVTVDGSGKFGICSNGKCACPPGYYQTSLNRFKCSKSAGSVPQGGNCTAQSQCARDLLCSFCPGGLNGNQYCFGSKKKGVFGEGCNSTADCDTTKGFTCLMLYGPSCRDAGRCDCPSKQAFMQSTGACGPASGLQDACADNSDCSHIRAVDDSGMAATCTNGKCTCPSLYYQMSLNRYSCSKSRGSVAQGGTCTAQSQCAQDLLCSFCSGQISGTQYCFSSVSESTSLRSEPIWLTVVSLLSTVVFIKYK